MFFFKFYHT